MDNDNDNDRSQSKARIKQYDPTAEPMFILPALELHFQTRQINGNFVFNPFTNHILLVSLTFEGEVHCSFQTDFYEHIMFTFNAEHFYFLHDLITACVKEKDRGLFSIVF